MGFLEQLPFCRYLLPYIVISNHDQTAYLLQHLVLFRSLFDSSIVMTPSFQLFHCMAIKCPTLSEPEETAACMQWLLLNQQQLRYYAILRLLLLLPIRSRDECLKD